MALIAIDGMPVAASFEAVKKLVQIDAEAKSVTRGYDDEAFWTLAEDVANGFKSIDVCSICFNALSLLLIDELWIDFVERLAWSRN